MYKGQDDQKFEGLPTAKEGRKKGKYDLFYSFKETLVPASSVTSIKPDS